VRSYGAALEMMVGTKLGDGYDPVRRQKIEDRR
jgi:hypothetical protein